MPELVDTHGRARHRPGSGSRPAWRLAIAAAAAAAVLLACASTSGAASRGGFLTIQFGRTELGMASSGCRPLANSVPLGRIARRMHRMGLAGTGAVIVDFTSTTRRVTCRGMIRYPGWQRLQELHSRYGWNFVSAGLRYMDPRRLSPEGQQRDICSSLPAFRDHGLNRAWGLFAYPDDMSNATVQSQVTARCCAKDFVHVLSAIPAGVQVVDPAAVAKAWGRLP